MKFSLFVHMERVSAADEEPRLYEEMLELCQMADEGGMHAIWTGEHHAMSFTIAPNPLLNLVDLARRTKNVRLGTGTVIAPFWHPIKLAGWILASHAGLIPLNMNASCPVLMRGTRAGGCVN
jgi:alkanesulfonate monooxygenase SsuD/methylene tetrahydromethanopterin reductase-like flavin-dependent oxidoreductase (luciferase family)